MMNEPTAPTTDNGFADAHTWAYERTQSLAKWARAGWVAAAVASTIAVLEALVLVAITPLKTVVPYTLLVDRTTGYTQTLEGLHPSTIRPDTALTHSLLTQYVVVRESYDIHSIQGQYRRVGLWSSGNARRDYLALVPASNPESPINLFPRTAVVDTIVSSVDSPVSGKAKVRFITERRDAPNAAPIRAWWVAEIDYNFTQEPLAAADRLDNPLGFTVNRYRRFAETPPSPPVPVTANTAPSFNTVTPMELPVGQPSEDQTR